MTMPCLAFSLGCLELLIILGIPIVVVVVVLVVVLSQKGKRGGGGASP